MSEIRDVKEVKRGRGGAVKKAPPGYYTAKEAQNKLGMNASTFGYYVRKGKISRTVPPLRSEGYYNKKEIDQLAREMALFLHTEEDIKAGTEVRAARPEDAAGIVKVLTSMGWKTTTPEQRISWYKVNPYIDYVVLSNGEVVGYIHAAPYKPSILEGMMSGKKRSWDIQPDDILPFQPGTAYNLYIGIAVRQDIQNHTRLAFRLIAGYMSFLEELARQGIYIRNFYGVSAEPDGQRIAKALGFEPAPAKDGDLFPRFILDMRKSDSHFAKQYKEMRRRINE